ncbi:MAG: peptidylprolyl isomerase [Kiritimatiellae bacterium]|nr:peptidylprolyl isomerase [Kiritimatiellia bacterium]
MDKKAIVLVDGEPVTEEMVDYEFRRLVSFYAGHMPEEQIRAQAENLRRQAVEQAIGAKLLFKEAERSGVEVSDEEVDQSFFGMARQAGGLDKLRAQLRKQGLSESVLKAQIRRGRRVDKLVASVTDSVPDPTEEECRDYFEAHSEEYQRGERVLAQHILITPKDSTPEAKKAARDKLLEIRDRVRNGADFGDEASAHSDCPSGKNGGSLGWFSRGMMVPEFEKAAFDMSVGDVSDIIETQFGYHIIYKTDHEAPKSADFEDAAENIRDLLLHSRRGEALKEYVAGLKAKAKIEMA